MKRIVQLDVTENDRRELIAFEPPWRCDVCLREVTFYGPVRDAVHHDDGSPVCDLPYSRLEIAPGSERCGG